MARAPSPTAAGPPGRRSSSARRLAHGARPGPAGRPDPMSSDLTTPDQAIDELLDAVGAAMAGTAPPRRLAGDALAAYLGDVVHVTFSGSDAARVALLARLLL